MALHHETPIVTQTSMIRLNQIASSRYKSQEKVKYNIKRTGPIFGKTNRTKICYPAII